jgi:hypothetical protein
MRSIEIGDSAFNANYILKSNNAGKAQALFANPRVRSRLLSHTPFVLRTGRRTPAAMHLPKGDGFLILHLEGVLQDVNAARAVCFLLGETMRALQSI